MALSPDKLTVELSRFPTAVMCSVCGGGVSSSCHHCTGNEACTRKYKIKAATPDKSASQALQLFPSLPQSIYRPGRVVNSNTALLFPSLSTRPT
ncbi:hypothetical protein BaRGS_00030268 [Batillaria attramentaria]|uniref:Uncharacterized protein n=1 Tax=Batillaria attramentaria TaxID=370345 RepID=A0ABD0JUY9_9CAEN